MKAGRAWRAERARDRFYRMAKERGYRSRAAFKLIEANRRFRFIRPGSAVVDLGCAPGGWLQVSSEAVGPKGVVLGVDLRPIKPLEAENVKFVEGDLMDPSLPRAILEGLGREADVVLCDAAPKLSGIRDLDHARQIGIAEAALEVAEKVLRRGGSMFVKAFEGPMLRPYVDRLRARFEFVRLVRPRATKPRSSEIYVLAMGFKGRRTP